MSTYRNRTTPGVYITELNAFPPSIPGVQTAVPAFIGYTETATVGGKSAYNTPIRINSLADYQAVFGAEFDPVYDINAVADASKDPYDFSGLKWDAASKTYKPAYYALARSTSVSVQENRGTEGGPAIV